MSGRAGGDSGGGPDGSSIDAPGKTSSANRTGPDADTPVSGTGASEGAESDALAAGEDTVAAMERAYWSSVTGGADEAFEAETPHEVRIAFVGRPNVGKSTLINRLLGENRLVAYDKPGTTRDAVSVPFTRAGRDYTLIDTAGVRRRGKVSEKVEIFSIIKTLQAVDRSQVCVMLVDANDGITEQDLSLLGYIIDKGRALVVAVNKWDSIDAEQREALRESLERRVEFLRFTRIHFISALHGSGVGDLFKSINRAHASAFVDLSTPRLTRMLESSVAANPPPMAGGRRIKLRYAHQGGQNPPIIVVHGNQAEKVPQNYHRYLTNHFMKMLRLFGTPLRIEFRQGDNPFAERRAKKVAARRGADRGRNAASGRGAGKGGKRTARAGGTRDGAAASAGGGQGGGRSGRGGARDDTGRGESGAAGAAERGSGRGSGRRTGRASGNDTGGGAGRNAAGGKARAGRRR